MTTAGADAGADAGANAGANSNANANAKRHVRSYIVPTMGNPQDFVRLVDKITAENRKLADEAHGASRSCLQSTRTNTNTINILFLFSFLTYPYKTLVALALSLPAPCGGVETTCAPGRDSLDWHDLSSIYKWAYTCYNYNDFSSSSATDQLMTRTTLTDAGDFVDNIINPFGSGIFFETVVCAGPSSNGSCAKQRIFRTWGQVKEFSKSAIAAGDFATPLSTATSFTVEGGGGWVSKPSGGANDDVDFRVENDDGHVALTATLSADAPEALKWSLEIDDYPFVGSQGESVLVFELSFIVKGSGGTYTLEGDEIKFVPTPDSSIDEATMKVLGETKMDWVPSVTVKPEKTDLGEEVAITKVDKIAGIGGNKMYFVFDPINTRHYKYLLWDPRLVRSGDIPPSVVEDPAPVDDNAALVDNLAKSWPEGPLNDSPIKTCANCECVAKAGACYWNVFSGEGPVKYCPASCDGCASTAQGDCRCGGTTGLPCEDPEDNDVTDDVEDDVEDGASAARGIGKAVAIFAAATAAMLGAAW